MIYFHNNHKTDDYILGLSPLILLFFINNKNKKYVLPDTTKCIQIYTSSKIKNIHININI